VSGAAEAGVAVILFAAAGGSWLVSLKLWPYTTCSWCNGTGRNPGSNSKRHGLCLRCKGSPRKLRLGARLVNSRLR